MRPSRATAAFRRGRRNGLPSREPQSRPWGAPLEQRLVGDALANKRISTDDYLTLVDAMGRVIRAGKRGAIPASLAPILAAGRGLDRDHAGLASDARLGGGRVRCADGGGGTRWVKKHCPLFARRCCGVGLVLTRLGRWARRCCVRLYAP